MTGENPPTGADAERPKRPRKQRYQNISRTVFYIFGHRVNPGGVYELTAQDKKDERGRKKLNRAVEIGLIKKA